MTNQQWQDELKKWRAEHADFVSSMSSYQKIAEKNKDFESARFFGDQKKRGLKNLKWVNEIIDFENCGLVK